LLTPSQLSATSHVPAAGRHTPVCLSSTGHAAVDPSQFSAGSHTPADARQTVDAGWKPSGGQLLLTPSQLSATSQGPADARHTAVLLPSGGHAALEPVQFSAVSQRPADARHVVVDDEKALAGQVELEPVQFSAGSQIPADARHCVPALPGACWQTLLDPLQRSVVQTLPSSVQAVPFVLNVHVVVQHEPAVPLFTPSSHDSGLSTTPSPQSE